MLLYCNDLVSFGGPDRRPTRCEDVGKVADGDDAEPPLLFFLLSLRQRFQHRLDGRQLGLDLLEG